MKTKSETFFMKVALLFGLVPSLALANLVWPGLYLAERMVVWSIPFGLLIETFIFIKITKLPFARALGIIFVINLFSTVLGAIGTAVGGIAWEATAGLAFYKLLKIGTFNPATWIFTIALGSYISFFLEMKGLKRFFNITLDNKGRLYFLLANCASTLLAFFSILLKPAHG